MLEPAEFFARWFPGELNHDSGYHKILSAALPKEGRILDLGCGDHATLARYRTAALEVWGADFDAHPQLCHPEWFRKLGAGGAAPFPDESFDLVTSYMVMEHVPEPARFFAEIARVLKPGGLYIGQSIHALHYATWIRTMLGILPHRMLQGLVKKLYGRSEIDTFPTCYRLNRRGVIARIARQAGLEWLEWQAYASQGYFSFSPTLYRLAVVWDWSLELLYSGLGKLYFSVVLRKPTSAAPVAGEAPIRHAA